MRNAAVVVLAAALAACSADRMRDPGVDAFRAQALAVEGAVAAYEADAAAIPDAAACADAHSGYDAQVRPMLERMQEMAAAMDDHMAEMGRAGDADMACAARQLMAELDRHAAAACASQDDMGPNVAEVGAHAGTMAGWTGHERARCDELGGMMGDGSGMMHGGGMMDPGATLTCPAAP